MKTKKLLFGLGLVVALGALGLLLWSFVVGIPPRSQSASVYGATERVTVVTPITTQVNKVAVVGTETSDPVATVMNDLCANFTGNQVTEGIVSETNTNLPLEVEKVTFGLEKFNY